MLQSSSGSKFPLHTLKISIDDPSAVGDARRTVMTLAQKLNFSEATQSNLGIIVNELANNIAKYALGGCILARVLSETGSQGIEVLAIDSGPGLDVNKAMQDGYTTGNTPGTGLGAVMRISSKFDLFSQPGKGTIVMARVLEHRSAGVFDFEIGAISIPIRGEQVCGDAWAVHADAKAFKVIVTDGLGHGPQAHDAAVRACEVFKEKSDLPLDSMMMMVHNSLKSTRGAAVFLASIEKEAVKFAGVGNIRSYLVSPTKLKNLISQNGTAGIQVRQARVLSESWSRDGFAVFHSDGLSTKSSLAEYPGILSKHPSIAAALLLRDFSRGTDDSTVVVVRVQK